MSFPTNIEDSTVGPNHDSWICLSGRNTERNLYPRKLLLRLEEMASVYPFLVDHWCSLLDLGDLTADVTWKKIILILTLDHMLGITDRIKKIAGRFKSSSCMKMPGRQLQQGGGWTPSSTLQYRFRTFRLPSCWPPEACTPRMPLGSRRHAETRRAWKSLTLQQIVLGDRHTASRPKLENGFIMKETLWENNMNFVKDIPMIYANFIIIVIVVSEEKIGFLTFVSRLLLKQSSTFYWDMTPHHWIIGFRLFARR